MWKSKERKRKETFEAALQEMLPAALQVSEKWDFYCSTLVFKEDVPLAEQIRSFSFPLSEFIRNKYPNISKADPMVYLATLLIGVYLAKTHPIPELFAATRHIESELQSEGLEELVRAFVQRTPNR